MSIQGAIQSLIQEHDVVLFMKGTSDAPRCGFSGHVVRILQKYNIPFHCVNVLDDVELREGIKIFSHWPTIPQLYIRQQFIGGCDIVHEMDQKNELRALIHDIEINS